MRLKIFFATLLSFALALSFTACEGDQGPAGPQGPQGPEGPIGETGPAGEGVQNCKDCHGSNQLITAKLFQWENSVHATGGAYNRNAASCAVCHTSQGFLEVAGTGATSTGGTIQEPLPQNCYTCHMIHQTYTDADWALTTSDPVTFWVKGEMADIGNSNLCINCHQARIPSPDLPEPGNTDMITLTNRRFGPHHGSQGVMFTGNTGYEIEGPAQYANSVHTLAIDNGCVNCHMAEVADGRAAGGHTFRVASEGGDLNFAGCVQCHDDTGELETLVEDTQAEIADLLTQLGARLNELGILDDALEYAVTPIDITNEQLGILWNYQYVREDNSFGVHNYKYAKALLENSIAALN
ncbi:MAG: ammonia-forming cytochrome c nitrite reductase subunit c552 [Phaeodactylibacter sp.]|nr:ammonia-forming cytochrome c nitrite reductase subunit c552 [Phaeodactylibacter sp.]